MKQYQYLVQTLFITCSFGYYYDSASPPPPPAIVHLGYPDPNLLLQSHSFPVFSRVVYQPVVIKTKQHSYEVVEEEPSSFDGKEVPFVGDKDTNIKALTSAATVLKQKHNVADDRNRPKATYNNLTKVWRIKPKNQDQAGKHSMVQGSSRTSEVKKSQAAKRNENDVFLSSYEPYIYSGPTYALTTDYEPYKQAAQHKTHSHQETAPSKVTKHKTQSHQETAPSKVTKHKTQSHQETAPSKVTKHKTQSHQESAHGSKGKSQNHKEATGGAYHHTGKEESHMKNKKHEKEEAKKGESGKESKKTDYSDEKGYKHDSHDEGKYGGSHHEQDGGQGGMGHLYKAYRDKDNFSQGFHNVHHKDEKKKLDSFWKNQHEEGEWHEYGSKKSKHGKKGGHSKGGKEKKEGKEESSYANKKEVKKGSILRRRTR